MQKLEDEDRNKHCSLKSDTIYFKTNHFRTANVLTINCTIIVYTFQDHVNYKIFFILFKTKLE